MSSSQNPFSHSRSSTARLASSSPRGGGPFHGGGHWGGGSPADMMDQPFTDEMRDLQARGKDPYAGDASDASDLSPERMGGGRMGSHHHHHHSHSHHHHHRAASSRQPKEPFTKIERRDWAETVLDNPELLMMYAQSSGAQPQPACSHQPKSLQTLPATRFRFKKIMCGLDEDEDDDEDDDDSIPETRMPGGGGYPQQKYQGQGQQPLRSSSSRQQQQQQQQQRGRGDGGSRSGRR
ncbi:hypothetical protein N8I77_005952 [Diaporthe amygdali]|uniref:Uncharacterized protein n=1 Tax=Phomopsis amygdali TaxID=1214568 RepID=A0AAD9SFP4_PHOAM|nr:hypothetical protein N8I77_005952 [Diaporthe amygdali]